MNTVALSEALRTCSDSRFAAAGHEMLLALEEPSTELRGDHRRMPRVELLTTYRDRRDFKRSLGTPWPVLEDLAEALAESTSESVRIYYIHAPGRMNTVFVNDDGSICACVALPIAERP